ncbi:MAG: tetratricopeptide repeat protein [Methylophilaceae bacterium]|nr:MAG: tetratricopeptide repeat protein [Methylophilaceae bacterium]
MNSFIAALAATLSRLTLTLSASVLVACLLSSPAFADELKDIFQMADQGQYVAAIEKLNAYISANPKNAQALFMKGVLLAEQGHLDEAIKVFIDVTEKFPTLPEPYNNLAVIYAEQGQYDKARKALETAIKTHPSYATAYDNLGDIYARMASVAYDKALQLDSTNSRTQTKLSLIKDLFGTGNKTTIATNEPLKVANAARTPETRTTELKKPEPTVEKVTSDASKKMDDEILASVNNWAYAWSAKNLDKYFASYASNFNPAKGESHKAWEAQRRERITKPAKISVELSNINITSNDSNNAKVHFKQSYRVGDKPIYTPKTLIMKRVGDNWLIEQEIAGH